jgi:hypothetical protein
MALATLTMLTLAILWASAVQAGHSAKPHPFTHARIQWVPENGRGSPPPAIFVGHDGVRYTELVGEFDTLFWLSAAVKAGYVVRGAVMTTSDPNMTDALPRDSILSEDGFYKRTLDLHRRFKMDMTRAVQTAVNGIDPNRVQRVIDRCNDEFGGTLPSQEQTVGEIDMHVHAGFSSGRWEGASEFVLDTWWPSEASGRPAIASTTFPARIVCLPRNDPRVAHLQPEPTSVDLAVDQEGDSCPKKTTVTAFIYYDRPATAKFRFKLDGKLSELITIDARKLTKPGIPRDKQKDVYLVKRQTTYHLDPGQHHFRIEVRGGAKSQVKTVRIDCPPFKVTSAWLKYEVEKGPACPKKVEETATFKATRPGKAPFEIKTEGGLVVHSGSAEFKRDGMGYVAKVRRPNLSMNGFDSDMMALIKNDPAANSGWTRLKVDCVDVLSGTLDLRAFPPDRCKGEAALSIRTSVPGNVPYRLECTGGKSWNRTAKAMKTGPDTYIGVDTIRFDVENNEQLNCALKTRSPLPVEVLALKGREYQCHRPSGASGADDLVPDTRPEEPPPVGLTLKGDFSFVDKGGTKCPRQGKALINFTTNKPGNIHYSLDCTNGSFSGVAQTVESPKGGYIAPALVTFGIDKTTKANCALKTVAPGKPKVHTVKGHLFQCVKPTGVSGSSDLAPETKPDPKAPSGPAKAIVTEPKISCAGGEVENGKCKCEANFKPVKAGKKAWRCVKVAAVDGPKKKKKKAKASNGAAN